MAISSHVLRKRPIVPIIISFLKTRVAPQHNETKYLLNARIETEWGKLQDPIILGDFI